MADVKNGVTKEEVNLVVKALDALKMSVMRAKTKDAGDAEMTAIMDRRLAQLDALKMKVINGSLF